MKNPAKTFPRGLVIGSLLTIGSYVLMILITGLALITIMLLQNQALT